LRPNFQRDGRPVFRRQDSRLDTSVSILKCLQAAYAVRPAHHNRLLWDRGAKAEGFRWGSELKSHAQAGCPDGSGQTGTGAYRFYTISDNIAFCVAADRIAKRGQGGLSVTVRNQDGSTEATESYQVIRIARNTVGSTAATTSDSVDPSACVKKEIYAEHEAPSQKRDLYTIIHFRSVDGMVEFLGRMLRVPSQLRPLKFDISLEDPDSSRFTINYLGQAYYVHDRQRRIPDQTGCNESSTDPRCEDKTLEILTLVNSLFNLNKSQKDLPSTTAVQVVI
jgi:hypothetical protein